MASGVSGRPEPTPGSVLDPADAKWLHDKFERLAAEEVQLAGGRTSYFAAIGTVLITGGIVAIADLQGEPWVLAAIITFLAGLGMLISFVWVVLLHRTNDAQSMWRECALWLERMSPPIPGDLRIPVTLRSKETLSLNVLRPYGSHHERFSSSNPISWLDRVNPDRLTETLPLTFLGIWSTAIVLVWVWYFLLR
ncbi:MAG TPA: hypothetical protein VN864_04885 [Thermoplasmata archaeon]|nr:hypothetical protein [Thermoplasmata archaeon]